MSMDTRILGNSRVALALLSVESGAPGRADLWQFGGSVRVGVVCASWNNPAGAPEDLIIWGAQVWGQLCRLASGM